MTTDLREVHVALNPVDFVLWVRVDACGAHDALASVLERQVLALFNLRSNIRQSARHTRTPSATWARARGDGRTNFNNL